MDGWMEKNCKWMDPCLCEWVDRWKNVWADFIELKKKQLKHEYIHYNQNTVY